MRLHLAVILLSLDAQVQAFQIKIGACSRAASAWRTTASTRRRLVSPFQSYCRPKGAVVARTSALHLSTDGAPEEGGGKGGTPRMVPEKATSSSTVGNEVDGTEVKDGIGHASKEKVEEGAGGVQEGGDGAPVKAVAPKPPPPVAVASSAPSKEAMTNESEFTELEKAFAEARKRSMEQGAVAKAPVAKKPAMKKAPPAAADEAIDASSAPKAKAEPPLEKPATTMPASGTAVSVPDTEKPAPSVPSPDEKPPVTTTPKAEKSSPEPKTPISPEKPSVESKKPAPIKPPATATPKAVSPSPDPKTPIPPEKPAVTIKAKEAKPKPAEKAPTGAFSLAAESLEEFFGLTKKPLLVSTTTPPKKSSGSSDDGPRGMAELDKAAVESMLKENGLNEVTLKEDFRQMEAEAKAAVQGGGKKSVKVKPPAEKPATPANPFESLATIFNPPAKVTASKETAPKEPASKETEAARPRVTAIKPEPEKQQAPAAANDGGLRGIFSGMFAEPVYDDEVDTLPKKGSAAPRAMPVFAPPPSPAKPKEKSDAPGPSPPSSTFLDGLFGGGKKVEAPKSPAPAPPPRVRSPAKVEAPAPAQAKEKIPVPSLFDGFFGGGKSDAKKVEPPSPVKSLGTPASKTSGKKAAPTQVKVAASSTPSVSPLFGLFGSGKSDAKPAPPAVPATKMPPPASAVPTPTASKKSKPSGGGMFDFLGSASTSPTKSSAKASAPPRPSPPPPQQKQQPAKSSGANMFAGLFGSAGGVSTSEKKKTAAAAAVAKPKRQPLPPPPAAPAPMVSRVKTMDDAFLKKVSIMLKRNQAKIKKFQQLTDRFRGGLITAPIYYDGVEDLFGEENVKEIIDPLLAALPEKDKGKALQMVYNKARSVSQVSSPAGGGIAGGLAGLFGGLGAKSGPPSSVSKKESKEASAGKGKAGAPAADPYAFAASKLNDADYQVFKTRTALFARGGINARNYYDTLEKLFGKKGVPQQLQAVLKVLPQNKRKLIQDVCDALNK